MITNQIEEAKNIIINDSELESEVKAIKSSITKINKKKRIELLMKTVELIDLTSLKGDETFGDIMNLCNDTQCMALGEEETVYTAAVCVYPAFAEDAIKCLKELNLRDKIEVASVAGDFPASKLPLQERIDEIKLVVDYGVDEVDIVINRQLALENKWEELYEELKLIRVACGDKKMKTILATGDLPDTKHVYIASMVAMLAGTDFVKTSTGKEAVNATLLNGLVICRAIKEYYDVTGEKVGLKPAGGIVEVEDALCWITMVKKHLGTDWCNKNYFRIGASRLLDNITKEVEKLKSEE